MRRGIFWCLAFIASAAMVEASPVLLYDVNFNADTVGLPPATGAGPAVRTMPSFAGPGTEGGAIAVVSSHGPLTDQPVELTSFDRGNRPSVLGGASMVFDLLAGGFSGFDVYHFSAQMVTDDLSGTSGVGFLFDQPFHALRVGSNAFISAGQSGQPNTILDTYAFGSLLTIDITVDVLNQNWSVSLDGNPAFSSATSAGFFMKQFRIGTTSHNPQSRSVYVDNIRITGQSATPVPEPSSGIVLLVGLALAALGKRHLGKRR